MDWKFGTATIENDMNEFDVAIQNHERHGSVVPPDIKASILVAASRTETFNSG